MVQAREAAQWIYKHSLCKLKDLSVVLRTNGSREPSPGSCTLTSTHIPILTHIHYTHKHICKNIFINGTRLSKNKYGTEQSAPPNKPPPTKS